MCAWQCRRLPEANPYADSERSMTNRPYAVLSISISSSWLTSNLESHLYLKEVNGSGGSSMTVEMSLLLLLPTMTWPTKMAIPRSPGVL